MLCAVSRVGDATLSPVLLLEKALMSNLNRGFSVLQFSLNCTKKVAGQITRHIWLLDWLLIRSSASAPTSVPWFASRNGCARLMATDVERALQP